MVLEGYALVFAYWGSMVMIPFFLCPLMVSWNIIKFGFSDFLPPSTFIDGLVRCILFYQHGKLMKSKMMMQMNIFGATLSVIYILLYYYYLQKKEKFYESATKSGIFASAIIIYSNWDSSSDGVERFQYVLAALNLSTMYYPLMGVKYIIRTKTTFGMPYPMIIMGQVVCTFWLLFAISINNYLFMVQMLIPFILGAIQIALYFVYPSTPNFQFSFPVAQPGHEPVPMTVADTPKKEIKDRKTRLEEVRRRKLEAQRVQREKAN